MRRRTAKENELADNARLLRAWRRHHAEKLEEALSGVSGAVMARLMEQLKNLGAARELVAFVAAQDWSQVSANDRLTALHEINSAICRLRESAGLPPLDDGIPGERDNAYRLVKRILSFP
jgi:predicted ABC-class ATPase